MVKKEVPQHLLKRAEQQLMAGEKILWAGKPRPLLFSPLDLLTPLAVFCLVVGCTLHGTADTPLWVSVAARFLLLGTGVAGILAPAAQRVARGYMVCVVTNHRAFRVYPAFFGLWKTESYGSQRLRNMKVKVGGDGYGDILFGYCLLASFIPVSWGFRDVPQVKQAAALLNKLREEAAAPSVGVLPPPAEEPDVSTLGEARRAVLADVMREDEHLCWVSRPCRGMSLGLWCGLLLQTGLCVALTWLIISLYAGRGCDARFVLTAAFYGCLLYVFSKNAARLARESRRCKQRFYALTTRRALVLHPRAGVEHEYTLRTRMMQEHRRCADGSGSLVLGYDSPDSPDVQGAEPQGFMDVPSLREAEEWLARVKRA